MSLYKRGSAGPEVKKIQQQLKELDHYHGPIDGIYGGGTESAVRAFQQAEAITADGIVGSNTWKHLFDEDNVPQPAILQKPLDYRCLALTGTFETGTPPPDCFAGLSGNFDDQAISFGVLQWNFGQGSLQPLLEKMNDQYPEVVEGIFADHNSELQTVLTASKEEQMQWGRSIQDSNRSFLYEPWRGLFKSLGRCSEFQDIQVKAARHLFDSATELARSFDLASERSVALMFDIKVQNGSIPDYVNQQIRRDFDSLPEDAGEEERLCIIANRRAEASNPRWVEDVRVRKLTIAKGQGTVHGMHYQLEQQYGIRLHEEPH